MHKDINQRTVFNEEARLYHKVRPQYPGALFDALIKHVNLNDDSRLLEIGPGTGQATVPLAERGYKIVAVELGAELAKVARENLISYENVEVVLGTFEDIEFTSEIFDLIFAATAFHWINPEVRFKKTHKLLKKQGYLAIIHTNHVSDENGDEFYFESLPIYKKFNLAYEDDNFRLPVTTNLKPEKLDEALFELTYFKAFPLPVCYTKDEYTKLIGTYSPILSLNPDTRKDFLTDISNLIENQFGGSLLKRYAMTLTIAKKKN